jgi:hypothetical protein
MLRYLFGVITICGLFLIIWINRGCEYNTKSPTFPGYSYNLEESKENGLFEFEVTPLNSTIMLDSGTVLEVKKAWIENTWSKQVLLIGKPMVNKTEGHQLIVILAPMENNLHTAHKYYYFLGNRPISNCVYYTCNRIDSINLPVYRELTATLSPKKIRKAFTYLSFVK